MEVGAAIGTALVVDDQIGDRHGPRLDELCAHRTIEAAEPSRRVGRGDLERVGAGRTWNAWFVENQIHVFGHIRIAGAVYLLHHLHARRMLHAGWNQEVFHFRVSGAAVRHQPHVKRAGRPAANLIGAQ